VPNGTGRLNGAFGLFDRPKASLREDLRSLRERCRAAASLGQRPHTGQIPYNRLRHLYAHALQVDVIFQPLKCWTPIRDREGRMHGPGCEIKTRQKRNCTCRSKPCRAWHYQDNPVWGKAPNGALYKSRRLTGLLTPIVTHGYLCDISKDLERLAINIWQMSKRHFNGLCRKIAAKIAASVRGTLPTKKSEPEVHFAVLTSNPASLRSVCWVAPKSRPKKVKYVPRYIPPHRRKGFYSSTGDSRKALLSAVWS